MKNTKVLENELFTSIICSDGIDFRGIKIGDSIDVLPTIEGLDFENRGGALPNYKYFIELGAIEELTLVYLYDAETKLIQQLELTLKTYPKFYWEEAGGTDEMEFFTKIKSNAIDTYLSEFTHCENLVIAHFENQLGNPESTSNHVVFKHNHQAFKSFNWMVEGKRLTLMSYLDDTKYPQGPITRELKLILR
nr:hypothetical protein [uncultured Brumimicrobium sp.]